MTMHLYRTSQPVAQHGKGGMAVTATPPETGAQIYFVEWPARITEPVYITWIKNSS